jgi:hypothetical protein
MPRQPEDKGRREKLALEPTIPSTSVKRRMPDLQTEPRVVEPPSGGSTKWVVLALVAAVAAAFWGLSERGPKKVDPAAATATGETTPTVPPPTPAKPSSRPGRPAGAATPPGTAASSAPAGSTAAAGAPGEAAPPTVAAMPTHKVFHHRHKKVVNRKAKAVKLPRLPAPPPPDNRP